MNDKKKTNKNVLAGIRCPNCGSSGRFNIRGETEFIGVSDDGCSDFEGMSWSDYSHIACRECEHAGKLKDFTEKKAQSPVFKVWIQVKKTYRENDDSEIVGRFQPDQVFNTHEEAEYFVITSVGATAKLQTIRTLIDEEEWNADFRDVLLAELGDGK